MSESNNNTAANCTGRREFLKSFLGFGKTLEKDQKDTEGRVIASFYWADLRTGQVGFPTGYVADHCQPGSIMKLITTASLCQKGLSELIFECRESITINECSYSCTKPHGRLSLIEALAQSCNVYFAQAAEKLTAAEIIYYARLMGMDRDVAGHSSLRLPDLIQGTVQSAALGLANCFSFHPLQILQLVSVIAKRGAAPALHSAEEPVVKSPLFRVELTDHTWDVIQEGMRMACRTGTLHNLDTSDRLKIAAKTGTATHGKSFQSWIAGYFPYDFPKYAFCLHAKTGTSQQSIPALRKYLFDIEWP